MVGRDAPKWGAESSAVGVDLISRAQLCETERRIFGETGAIARGHESPGHPGPQWSRPSCPRPLRPSGTSDSSDGGGAQRPGVRPAARLRADRAGSEATRWAQPPTIERATDNEEQRCVLDHVQRVHTLEVPTSWAESTAPVRHGTPPLHRAEPTRHGRDDLTGQLRCAPGFGIDPL